MNNQVTLWPWLSLFLIPAVLSHAAETERSLDFVNDVSPIITKESCNTGACHAKAGNGQNGFKLSVLGFEPQEDYEHIVKEGRGRRVFAAAPEESLLLLKGANIVPHGGGKKLDPNSENYRVILNWLRQGAVYQRENAPVLQSIEVTPSRNSMKVRTEQQLKVRALYSDGSTRDVTSLALYEPNDKSMAESDEAGLVKILDIPGNVAIMVRYQGKSGVYSASIPLGAPVENLPPTRNFIDQFVFSNLKLIGVPPSPVCDDPTFLRRVTLDIAGRLPTTEEANNFLTSKAPDKRDRLIDSLLDTPDYADYFANKWSALLKNKRDEATDITANFAFHSWVRDSLLANKPYDQIVRQILGATGNVIENPPVAWYKRVKEPQQQLEDIAQLFLGVRMQCVQCHHHPFEKWSQADYYSLAAFFSRVGRKTTATPGEDIIYHKRGLAQAENKKTRLQIKPAGLGGPTLEIPASEDPRLQLADWMSNKANPFFAKALVNRYWKHFFKRALVEPEDDMRDTNPPTNPELLDALANAFIESGYDLKALIRVIAHSQTYQLSAMPNQFNAIDRQNYSHYYPKHLSAEVLLDAVDQFTGSRTDFPDLPNGVRAIALPDNSYNRTSTFLKVFGRPEGASACECERSQSSTLAQSLHLMNGPDVRQKLAANAGLAETLAKSSKPVSENIRALYLTAFAREPRAEESQIAQAHLEKPRSDATGAPLDPLRSKRQGYEDLLWSLMNTKEFLYNH
ncbi:MAG: DUF1549 domain-containing protein [Verrucomicrobiota bacterium]